MTFHPINIRL